MPDRSFLAWPFFDDRHRDFAERLENWCTANLPVVHDDVDTACVGGARIAPRHRIVVHGAAARLQQAAVNGKTRVGRAVEVRDPPRALYITLKLSSRASPSHSFSENS